MGNRSDRAYGQCGMSLLGLHGSRVMGYMGNRPHEQWGIWAIGHMGDGDIAIIMYRSRWGTWVIRHIGNGTHSRCTQ